MPRMLKVAPCTVGRKVSSPNFFSLIGYYYFLQLWGNTARTVSSAVTFEVDFMEEKVRDFGGPRKEWIRHMNFAIKEKYFDQGLREHISDDYFCVGIMMDIVLLQNGQLTTFLPVNFIE